MNNLFTRENTKRQRFAKLYFVLFEDERLKKLSDGAKLLYSIMANRAIESLTNNWFDEEEQAVYIRFCYKKIEGLLGWGDKKVTRVLRELEEAKLIHCQREGNGKSSKIFVYDCVGACSDHRQNDDSDHRQNDDSDHRQNDGVIRYINKLDNYLEDTPLSAKADIPPTGEDTLSPADKRFDEFWRSYPKKVGKTSTLKSWRKLKPSQALLERMLKTLEWQKRSEQWVKGFIPNPTTWLNQGRWEDESPEQARENEAKEWLF